MAQMQEYGIIDKPAKPAAPEPVKAAVPSEVVKAPVAEAGIKYETSKEKNI
jgi:hypothetical protein